MNIAFKDEKLNLTKLTLQNAVSPIENPKLINESKKTIARILTEKRVAEFRDFYNYFLIATGSTENYI